MAAYLRHLTCCSCCCAFVCVQRRGLDAPHRGKALVYLEKLMIANPSRTHALCLLTDLDIFEVYKAIRRSDSRLAFCRCAPVKLSVGKPIASRHMP